MKVKFWGVRGSIPSPISTEQLQNKLIALIKVFREYNIENEDEIRNYLKSLPFPIANSFGGNTACIEIRFGNDILVLDAGSGLRSLGYDLMDRGFSEGNGKLHLFISHTHWDHIQGIPFFKPLYIKGNEIIIISPIEQLYNKLKLQQHFDYFPVSYDSFAADIKITKISTNKSFRIQEAIVKTIEMYHPGDSYAISIEYDGKKIVYTGDVEFNHRSISYVNERIEFFKNADLIIFDSQYEADESYHKIDWGHSSAYSAIEIAGHSKARRVAFFHHEPAYDDERLFDMYIRAINYEDLVIKENNLEVIMSYEGLEIDI